MNRSRARATWSGGGWCRIATASPPAAAVPPTMAGHNGVMNGDRVRVLFQPSYFLAESWNGMDECLWLLATHLDRRRFELLLLAGAADGPQTSVLAGRAGLQLVPVPYPRGAGAWQRVSALRRLYARERVDLVHLHSPAAGGHAVPALAARLGGVRATLATYHQIQPRRLPPKARAVNYLAHAFLIDITTAVSADVEDTLVQMAGLPRRVPRVVPNGIELAPPAVVVGPLPERMPGEVRLGYFGRLSAEKGVAGLLAALAELARLCPQARTLIVGDGPERDALEATAARLGIGDRVAFLGFRPDARLIMEQVDIVVHTPVYEGFGLVVLEAMAAGRPVVTNGAPGGIADIVVHNQTGIIVRSGGAQVLAAAIGRLAASPEERRRLGVNGRARCEQHFSAHRMVDRVTALYDEALGREQWGRAMVKPLEWIAR